MPNSWGTVFRLNKSGKEAVLYAFSGRADGGSPEAGLVRDDAGNLYGATAVGGTKNFGVIYKVDKNGKETVRIALPEKPTGHIPRQLWSEMMQAISMAQQSRAASLLGAAVRVAAWSSSSHLDESQLLESWRN